MAQKGKGQKEKDGAIRDKSVFCVLPLKKIITTDLIAKSMGISRTDAISEALDLWIDENSVYIQENMDI